MIRFARPTSIIQRSFLSLYSAHRLHTEINFPQTKYIVYNRLHGKESYYTFFQDIKNTKEYDGYFYKVTDAITIVLLGSICGLKNISQIHQWAFSDRIKEFLKENSQIKTVPCYYWLLCLMKLIKLESFNRCLANWSASMLPKTGRNSHFLWTENNPLHRENEALWKPPAYSERPGGGTGDNLCPASCCREKQRASGSS